MDAVRALPSRFPRIHSLAKLAAGFSRMEQALAKITQVAASHPKPSSIQFQYGTAGFRTKADVLDPVMFRIGILASLRSMFLGGRTIGVMITASHNPEEDNGVKLVDPGGEMLESHWETYATSIANTLGAEELVREVSSLSDLLKIDWSVPASVIYGRDTRPSGPALVASLAEGISCIGTSATDFGIVTTPILHYLVRCVNTKGTPESYGDDSEEAYYSKLSGAFLKLMASQPRPSPLLVDCANGVGATAIESLSRHLNGSLELQPQNIAIQTKGSLNFRCGADFVKTNQRLPESLKALLVPGQRACSLDGDADRLIYYYLDSSGTFRMLDGDKIASLVADFIVQQVNRAGIADDLQVGVVQTAYANGSSTRYLEQRLPVRCASTGVKHLHHAAEQFSIGVYFEANGHGTVLFSHEALSALRSSTPRSDEQREALENLNYLATLINQTVGDALSDMLLVEVILAHRSWSPSQWDEMYKDLPNRLMKVSVPDRNLFETEDAERRLVSPPGMQSQIDKIVGDYPAGRGFVRPSGTEDVVRVYTEASTTEAAIELASRLAGLVYDGSGGEPSKRPAEFL